MKCETGCQRYDGDEAKHLPTYPYYPESLTKLNDDKIKELEAELEAERITKNILRDTYEILEKKLAEAEKTIETAWTEKDRLLVDAKVFEMEEKLKVAVKAMNKINSKGYDPIYNDNGEYIGDAIVTEALLKIKAK